jgi:protoporphyrinogen oxidase
MMSATMGTPERTEYLILGAGMTGLAFADAMRGGDYLLCEGESEPGGYCRTIARDGFVWDYSGHFFHWKHKALEEELVSRMGSSRVLTIQKDSRIYWKGEYVDFPFQKNIHQLPKEDFIDCLHDLYFREGQGTANFKEMLYAKFGRSIAEFFLIPYNEKLYATDLARLDVDAMGRFFPHASMDDIVRNFRHPDNASYNAAFTYPEGGAVQYVNALLTGVDPKRLSLGERVVSIDAKRKVATTTKREIAYKHLVSSAPFVKLLGMLGEAHDPAVYDWNKVLVFNLGFDRKGPESVHWIYYPQRELSFYRVGFYDNIFGAGRMSLYVELGRPKDAVITEADVESLRARVLDDLRKVGLVTDHQLVASHSVVLDPAYVHITAASVAEVASRRAALAAQGVHSIGRYGRWTYSSIEDNVIEARELAGTLKTA